MSYNKYPSYGRIRMRDAGSAYRQLMGHSGFYYLGKDYPAADVYTTATSVEKETCLDSLHPGPPYRVGGPFWNIKVSNGYQLLGGGDYRSHGSVLDWYWKGYFEPNWPVSVNLSNSVLKTAGEDGSKYDYDWLSGSSSGASAWNRFRPKTNVADLGIAVAECREIPTMLKKTARYFHHMWKEMGGHSSYFKPRVLADHWLNTQFGWRPFINDLRDLFTTTLNYQKNLSRLRKHNGRWLKRSGSFSKSSDLTLTGSGTSACFWPSVDTHIMRSANSKEWYSWDTYDIVSDDIWFEARFRYWIPSLNSDHPFDKVMNTLNLYGIRVSPSLVWNATPWTWLADWFGNAGDVIDNFTAQTYDHLAAKYAYIMRHRKYIQQYTGHMYLKDADITGTFQRIVETKSRDSATPFGFGLSVDDFTPWQCSILTALGLTRRP